MPTNEITAIEGIDIYNSYELVCIDRVNTKINTISGGIDIPTLKTQVDNNTTNITTLQGQMTTANTDISTLTANLATTNTNLATLTTTVNNNKRVYNVKDYGAVGDNTNDDTTSIQNAINAMPSNYSMLFFPRGKYKITSQLLINSKGNFDIISEGAVIACNLSGASEVSGLRINNCIVYRVKGLTFECGVGGLANSRGLTIDGILGNNYSSSISDCIFTGDFKYGLFLGMSVGELRPYRVSDCYFNNCRIGLWINNDNPNGKNTEYVNISNCNSYFNSECGCVIKSGNCSITGGLYTSNRIGIFLDGSGYNADHGRLIGVTINHNSVCNLWIRDCNLGYIIDGCHIWACLAEYFGGGNFNGGVGKSLYSSVAQGFRYGLYIENSNHISIINCHIARTNSVNMGVDGWNYCIVSNCIFETYTGATLAHIWEGGTYNSFTSPANQMRDNILTNNVFIGTVSLGTPFSFHNATNTLIKNYHIFGNRGDVTSNKTINSVSSWVIGDQEYVHIDANAVGVASTSSSPSDQPTNIYLPAQRIGSRLTILFYNASSSLSVWIRFRTTEAVGPQISSVNLLWDNTNKALKCTNVGRLEFYPRNGDNGNNGWLISAGL